jgi:hypothetical protein
MKPSPGSVVRLYNVTKWLRVAERKILRANAGVAKRCRQTYNMAALTTDVARPITGREPSEQVLLDL